MPPNGELSQVSQVIHTTSQTSTGDIPFYIVYGVEAINLVQVELQ